MEREIQYMSRILISSCIEIILIRLTQMIERRNNIYDKKKY